LQEQREMMRMDAADWVEEKVADN